MDIDHFIVIDFDSTLVTVEALDELAAIALADSKKQEEIVQTIRDITRRGMEGSLPIDESLRQRLALLSAKKQHLTALIKLLKQSITPSFLANRDFLKRNAERILIFTSGFSDYVVPVISELGLQPKNVFANSFTYSSSGKITGFDKGCLMGKPQGKVMQLKALKLPHAVDVIGDGITDSELRSVKGVRRFYAFIENVEREQVTKDADKVIRSFDEYLHLNNLPKKFSYPKSKIRVLLLEAIHPHAVALLKEEGYAVEALTDALDEDELIEHIKGVSLLGIRSKTRVTKRVLAAADRLMAIGAFCIGTDQIDLSAAAQVGVAAFNAPYSNTRSVVELALGEIILLMRRTVEMSAGLHQGRWQKSASGSYEVRGKKLGIIGYGNIGAQLSVLAEALGMEVYYYDVVEKLALGNARRCRTLPELLKQVDVVSLHVDGRGSNKNLIGEKEFASMKQGVIFLNLSRGHVVDIEAMERAVRSGKIAGAAIDVFPKEPKSNKEEFLSPLRGLPNVILTPHLGGSTLEAQKNIGEYVAARLMEYVNIGTSFGSVNFPQLQLPTLHEAHRLLHVHRNTPGILAKINSTLADNRINILGQYLKTTEDIGYVITDVDKKYSEKVIGALRAIPDTIKFRVLY